MSSGACILAVNGGSSSIKCALYQMGAPPQKGLHGKIERIGLAGTQLVIRGSTGKRQDDRSIGELDHRSAANFLFDWLDEQIGLSSITAVGHRVVNGGANYREPHRLMREVMEELHRNSTYAPEHLPSEIELIDMVDERMPGVPQLACFDTAFHRDMPRVLVAAEAPPPCGTSGATWIKAGRGHWP